MLYDNHLRHDRCNGQQGLLCMSPPLGGMAVQASEKEAAARGQEEREK